MDSDIEAMKIHLLEFDELITYFVLMIAAFEEVVAMDDVKQNQILLDVVTVYSFLLVLTIKGFVLV